MLTDLDKDCGELADVGDLLQPERIRGFVGAPLVLRDEVLGVLGSFSRVLALDGVCRWGRIFGDRIAAAIVNARAFEEIPRLRSPTRAAQRVART